MDEKFANQITNKVLNMIFNQKVSFPLDIILSKFAFDVKLPKKVFDSITGQETWTSNINSTSFITQSNMEKYDEKNGWLLPKRNVNNLKDILDIWKKVNYTTTERQYDCINVSQCDPIYNCENAFRCTDLRRCKNIVFCDGCDSCEFSIACQRSANCNFCLRVDDSGNCTNSYNVICSNGISNSFFIQDCSKLHECIFCSHISNKKFCIANMQFEEDEYFFIKKYVVDWILNSIQKK